MESLLAQALEVPSSGQQVGVNGVDDDHHDDNIIITVEGDNEQAIVLSESTSSMTCPSFSPPISPLTSPIAAATKVWEIDNKSPNRSNPIPIPPPLTEEQQQQRQQHHDHQSQRQLSDESSSGILPLHSDFTVPTSNLAEPPHAFSPPQNLTTYYPKHHHHRNQTSNRHHHNQGSRNNKITTNGYDDNSAEEGGRRSVFGASVGKRYVKPGSSRAQQPPPPPEGENDPMIMLLTQSSDKATTSSGSGSKQPGPKKQHRSTLSSQLPVFEPKAPNSPPPTIYNEGSILAVVQGGGQTHANAISPLTPHDAPYSYQVGYHQTNGNRQRPSSSYDSTHQPRRLRLQSIDSDSGGEKTNGSGGGATIPSSNGNGGGRRHHRTPAVHETIHAQSLLLGLAFMAVWMPNNVMAPNLTQIAAYFGMSDAERDLYLGSYCALAVGVFSLPISGLIGFLTDMVPSRKILYVGTVVVGALASALTGWSPNYATLLFGRLINGGCMSGSVPVAFSLLGDLFSAEERNAASSGLTAMMGCGILLGQVYAGLVGGGGDTSAGASEADSNGRGWSHAFFLSSGMGLITALSVLLWVQEPVRGGKEKVLLDLMEKTGTKYDRKLTWQGFVHAMQHNPSNSLLIWQGFFTSLPWGIVFVFLNDFLSQEKGFSVPDATLLVMLFGIGCAVGGIVGGAIGQVLIRQRQRRYLLPIFMAASTWGAIVPFLLLLNGNFLPHTHNNWVAMMYTFMGGVVASLPSVNVRPCIINVNPPETRGAALTAANLMIALARGAGPSCITLLVGMFPGQMTRQGAFNITLSFFWTLTALQLLWLAKTLPADQDAMEAELANFAARAMEQHDSTENLLRQTRIPDHPHESLLQPQLLDVVEAGSLQQKVHSGGGDDTTSTDIAEGEEEDEEDSKPPSLQSPEPWQSPERPSTHRNRSSGTVDASDCETSVVSIEERITSFDNDAARQSIAFMQQGIREIIHEERLYFGRHCGDLSFCGFTRSSNNQDEYDDDGDDHVIDRFQDELADDTLDDASEQRRLLWVRQQMEEQQRLLQQQQQQDEKIPLVPDLPALMTTNATETQEQQQASEETPLLRSPI